MARRSYDVGRGLAERGIGLVYGGGGFGLMGEVSQGALDAGGEVLGVIPRSMMEREWGRDDITELHVVETMHERKAMMAEFADAFLCLPGGLGTLRGNHRDVELASDRVQRRPRGLPQRRRYLDATAVRARWLGRGGFHPARGAGTISSSPTTWTRRSTVWPTGSGQTLNGDPEIELVSSRTSG